MKKSILLVLVVMTSVVSNAYDAKIDGIYYNFYDDEAEVTFREYNMGPSSDYTGTVVIPASVDYDGKTYSVTAIGDSAFYMCPVTSVTLPNSLTRIGAYAFEQCQRITSVTIPNGVTTIEEGTFYLCTNLKSVIIPEGVTSIQRIGFLSCHYMESVSIPSSMTYIGEGAFAGCDYLKDVFCCAEQVPETEDYVFLYDPIDKATLHVPAGSVEKYKATEPWSAFGNIVSSPDLVTYTEGQMATIILPSTPDVSMGKYYRLDRCEDGKIIFEEVLNPKARTPYIIMPNQDFAIDLSMLDMAGLSQDTVSIQGISFIGSYIQAEFDYKEDYYIDIIDITDDCRQEESAMGKTIIGPLRAFLQVSKSWEQPLSVTLLPLKTDASFNLAEAKQKLASFYKYAKKYEDKLRGDEGALIFCDINNPDSLADINMEADLKKYIMLVGQGQSSELSIPRELYNPDIEVEIGSDVFFNKSNSVSYYKAGAGTKSVAFDNDAFSFITNKYGRVSSNDFFYLENPGPSSPPRVEIKLLGNIPSASNMAGMELPTQVMSGKYDIMVVMVPYWYRTIAESEAVDANFYNQDYVDSVSACNKMYFRGMIRYNNYIYTTNGKDVTTLWSKFIEYDGSRVDTLMLFRDFEFPYSYKDLSYSYPTLILDGATNAARSKQGFLYSLCIDRVIMRSKESGEEIVIAPKALVTYTEGQMATIVLPTTPDASKGKYYRLDRCEDDKIVFEEELNPQARVPYIIVPNQDFFIDLSMLDLAGLSQETVSIKGISFIGSYTSERLESKEGWYVDIIDKTPDCSISPSGETGKEAFLIGALRAFLQVSWEDPYSQGPTKGEPVKMEIVLHDNGTSIAEMESDRVRSEKYDDAIYDLSGRKIDSSLFTLHPSLKKGVYIQNGKKVAIK